MKLPLEGVRILAVEQYGAGPYGTLQLASLGAEIIKLETVNGGDVSRSVGPCFIDGEAQSTSSYFYQGLNHNKKSIAVDLTTEGGKGVLHALVKTSDGLISNMRGDVVDRLGLNYESLRSHNPRLVCAHLTAYGRTGTRASWPGYDYLMQAQTGYFSLTGEPEAPPTRFGLSVVDLQTGVTLATAFLAGLVAARSSGQGRDLDVSLFDVALHNLNYIAMWSLNAGQHQRRVPRSAHFSLTPCQLYTTRDGWIYLMCNKEKFWRNLCMKIKREDLLEDPRFNNFATRLQNRDALTAELDGRLSQKTTDEWLQLFGAQVPAAALLGVEEALTQAFVQESGHIQNCETESGATLRTLRPPIGAGTPFKVAAAPSLGQQTDALLAELGYTETSIKQLRKNGEIG